MVSGPFATRASVPSTGVAYMSLDSTASRSGEPWTPDTCDPAKPSHQPEEVGRNPVR